MQFQKFGLEIRQVGNLDNIYQDVDLVLRKFNIPKRGVSVPLQAATVAHSLQRMMQGDRHFSICTIDECAKVCNVIISRERYDVYRALHCVEWRDMLPDYRQAIIAMLLDDFRDVLNPSHVNKISE